MSQTHLPARLRDTRRPTAPALLSLTALLALLVGTVPAWAGGSPATPVPSDRWGSPQTMRPWEIIGDSTHYDGRTIPTSTTPVWFGADSTGKYLFSATGKGVMVHDMEGNPQAPQMLGYTYMFGNIPTFFQSDLKFYIYDVAVPKGDPDVFVSAGEGHGALIWDFSHRGNPQVLVQDYQHGATSDSAWATRIGNNSWAFFAVGGDGVSVYDLERAKTKTFCDTLTGPCQDVYTGSLNISDTANAVHGTGSYLAVAAARAGVELWNVSNPGKPTRIGVGGVAKSNIVDVAMWQSGGKHFVAAIDSTQQNGDYPTYVFDVSCVTSGGCSSAALSNPIATLPSLGHFVSELTLSQSEGRSYLYVGHLDRFASVDQREFLWDVTDPYTMDTSVAGPHELTPDNEPGKGYWGWYYGRNDTGFQNMAPMEAIVHNGYLYRTAWTIYDVHELLGAAPPNAAFDWSPKPVYQGQAVSFTDQSSGAPSAWLWQFSGASPSSSQSTLQNPTVTFNSIGTASVTLSAANEAGYGDPVTREVSVLDPTPAVGSVSASPSSALVCQQVALSANDVTGRPPLTYAWAVKDDSGSTVATGGDSPTFAWDTSNAVAGTYTAEVTVTNSAGSDVESSGPITLSAPPPLAIESGPSTEPFDFGTVQFRADTAGASLWTWDFGDGTQQSFTQQSEGENPVHNYTEVGTYTVTLTVDNCLETEQSETVQVVVTQIDPLTVSKFEARSQCQIGGGGTLGGCFEVDKAITFDQTISGSPDLYEYDWDGNGTYEESASSPVTTHTYGQAGTFTPKIRVTRGNEPPIVVANGCTSSDTSCIGTPITVGAAQPATISISGAGTGTTGQSLAYSATVTNCTASSTGWSWNASGGGTVNGSGGSVSIVWGSAGSKTVTATNSGCANATGTKFVSISTGGDGGGGGSTTLTARYTYTPTSPSVGQAVSFDGSSSSGSPTTYTWDFGDGTIETGSRVSHTFGSPGSYQVSLYISKSGNCTGQVGGAAGLCTDDEIKTVVVKSGNAVTAAFEDDVDCGAGQVGGSICVLGTGEEVAFSDTSTGKITKRTWDFGDGETATGKSVTHSWKASGVYTVTLTVENEEDSSTTSKTYTVNGPTLASLSSVVVPWIARADADKALPQSSDLDVHNPGAEPLTVKLTFRKRGLPEPDPPQVEQTIAPNGTLHVPDAMAELFGRPNLSGFVFVEPVEGGAQPVITSANHTFRADGAIFGQVVPGLRVDGSGEKAGTGSAMTHLVGLNANDERLAYFGISNPNDQPFYYHLRFYDSLGRLVGGTQVPEAVARFGQKQYQSEDLAQQFGIDALDDYRIEIVPEEGSPVPFVYGANLRRKSFDPSFVRGGRTDTSEVFLVGALNTPGLNDSFFRSDVVFGNTVGDTVLCDLSFTGAGFQTEPTAPITETLQPGESLRMVDVVSEWDVGNAVGALRIACEAPGGVFPVIQGESYDTSKPGEYYGQFMPALTEDDAAVAGGSHTLVGLRKDDQHRTTVWLFNPSDDVVAEYDLLYFDVNGNQLGSETGVRLGRGKFRQINPDAHPLPETVPGGFVVRIDVKSGKLLTAGQVVNQTNDPAYIVGQ